LFPDETLPIKNKPKHPKRREYKEQSRRTHVQEVKKSPKRVTHKGNIKFPNALLSREAYQIRKGKDLSERTPS
jgi:hypothetical protein